MASFDWILSEPMKSNGFPAAYELVDFLRRSGLPEEESDWMRLANDWGRSQVPPVQFGIGGDARLPTALVKR